MLLVIWNSQGAKWDAFWNYITPLLANNVDIVGLLIESGWAPWINSGDVKLNAIYPCTEQVVYFNTTSIVLGNNYSAFTANIVQERKYYGFWIPWQKNLDKKSNTRVSMGGVLLPKSAGTYVDSISISSSIRPVVRVLIGSKNFAVFLVHLISGVPVKAQEEMNTLISQVRSIIPEGYRAIVVGDMNIDLLTTAVNMPNNAWSIKRVGYATQKSGGELDYGLLYDPIGTLGGTTVTTLANVPAAGQPGPISPSDHAVMLYSIPI
jgi:hypothetical protein